MSSVFIDEALVDATRGGLLTLTGAEAKHAVTVTRVRVGERVLVGNGQGLLVRCVVETVQTGEVILNVEDVATVDQRHPQITLAQALAKGDRDERAVQMSTELGVTSIIPWQARRSVSRWDSAKASKGVQRWQTIAREATKQSLRAHIPQVRPLESPVTLAAYAATQRMLVLDPEATTPLSSIRLDDRPLLLVVGPEGGIDGAEMRRFADAGAERVRLGANVLRTSSAGPAALAVLNVISGHW
ncbi:16S rRNA (uracil(1498)-N(3))-methyltransferase [Paramicrobacterium agarici]|uniref:Ribosomal RNA small subunit methyltransferase E n=1 Tax=Paramicrobacterium agarici TaxID=630514 RepID=A0A2A9DZ05_9MICO|nr:16S rRNA (uracil(1498)-N(3))-methyltransferase [Microbacterium agarici]PFG31212.1 16S rRNA (uracil1498-N3)-methyltransferase [Microbacterium agarici]